MSRICNRATEQEWYRPKKESDVTQDEIKFAHAFSQKKISPLDNIGVNRGRGILCGIE
jgi:hypothetical protein